MITEELYKIYINQQEEFCESYNHHDTHYDQEHSDGDYHTDN